MECRLTSTAAGVLGALGILVLMMGPETVQAKVSDSTGTIQGRAPTATGSLLVQAPDGNVVNNNDLVDKTWVPNNFTASADTTELRLGDLDGDCGVPMDISGVPTGANLCTATVTAASATKVWKQPNGSAMSEVMLAAPFQTYFSGKAVKVTVSAPVTTTSTTGAPVSGIQTLSSVETTVAVPLTPGILVGAPPGSYRWDVSKGFPTTGATGLQFTVNLADDGNNVSQTDFTWTTNQPAWASVDPNGVVTFTAAPTSATNTVTITATSKANPAIKTTYNFTVGKWFDVTVKPKNTTGWTIAGQPGANFTAACTAKFGSEWRSAEFVSDLRGGDVAGSFRAVNGALMREWGAGGLPADKYAGSSMVQIYGEGTLGYYGSPVPVFDADTGQIPAGNSVVGTAAWSAGSWSRNQTYTPAVYADATGWWPPRQYRVPVDDVALNTYDYNLVCVKSFGI